MSGTPLIPGWFINFQAAVLKQLPRPGEISQDIAFGWEKNQDALKKALAEGLIPRTEMKVELTEKFALLVDLGIITVPDDYDHATALDRFIKNNREKFRDVNGNIVDAHFPNPTRVLKPGDRLWVRAFGQIVPGTTTSEERMAFSVTQKAIYTGAQGASLVFEQKRDQLPKGKWYISFDVKDRLLVDPGGDYRMTVVDADLSGDFRFGLGYFDGAWRESHAFFCFCDLPSDEAALDRPWVHRHL